MLSTTCTVRAPVAFVGASGEIFLAQDSDASPVQLTIGASAVGQAELSPDGKQLLFVKSSGGIFLTAAVAGSPVVSIPASGATTADVNPVWSPDGSRIAFERHGQIFVMGSTDTTAHFAVNGVDPAWSPDGQRLAYLSAAGTTTLTVSTVSGANLLSLVTLPLMRHPRWSFDGSTILFEAGSANTVFVVSAAGGIPMPIEDCGTDPEWLPDDTGVSFLESSGALVALRPASRTGVHCTLMASAGAASWARRASPRRFNIFFLDRGKIQSAISNGTVAISKLDLRWTGHLPAQLSVITREDDTSGLGTLTQIAGATQVTSDAQDVAAWSSIAFSPNGHNILYTDIRGASHLVSRDGSFNVVNLQAGAFTRFEGYVRATGVPGSPGSDFIVAIDAQSGALVLFQANPDGTIALALPITLTADGALNGSCVSSLAFAQRSPRIVASIGLEAQDFTAFDLFLLPGVQSLASMPLTGLSDPRLMRITDAGVIPPGMLSINPALTAAGNLVLFASDTANSGFELRCGDGPDNNFGALSLAGGAHLQLFLSPTLQTGTKQAVPLLATARNQFRGAFSHNGMMLAFIEDTHPGHADSTFQVFLAKVRIRKVIGKGEHEEVELGGGDRVETPNEGPSDDIEVFIDDDDDVTAPANLPPGLRKVKHVRRIRTVSTSSHAHTRADAQSDTGTQAQVNAGVTLAFSNEEFSPDELANLVPAVAPQGSSVWQAMPQNPIDASAGATSVAIDGNASVGLGVSGQAVASTGGITAGITGGGTVAAGGTEMASTGVSAGSAGGGGCRACEAREGGEAAGFGTPLLVLLSFLVISKRRRSPKGGASLRALARLANPAGL